MTKIAENRRSCTCRGATKVDLGAYRAGRFHDLRIVARPGGGTATVYLDGRQVAAGLAFRTEAGTLDRFECTVSQPSQGAASIDDVRLGTEPAATRSRTSAR
ncbi:hypothetical protein [Actinoplanes sp. NPDC049118]|uniref:hypothetical protein n=1 Tax=Actinoplanes sp. NPDC049118 TaxID=3155769 RepID=UPI0033F76422